MEYSERETINFLHSKSRLAKKMNWDSYNAKPQAKWTNAKLFLIDVK